LINNANNSIAQIKFREKTVTEFVLSIESFLKTRQVADFPKLKKAHDSLIINQVNKYVATNDKPMLKYLDKQILYSSKEELQSIANFKSDQLALLIIVDMESLKVIIPDGVDLKTDIMDTYSINSETFINAIADNDDNNLRAFDVTKLESNAALQVIF